MSWPESAQPAATVAPPDPPATTTAAAPSARPVSAFLRRLWSSSYRYTLISTAVAVLLAWVYLLLPPQDTDLAAQLARADFAAHHPLSLIDFRWFGGISVYGYTLWTAFVMAAVGTKLTGAIVAVLGTWYLHRLLQRLAPSRPLLGGIAAAVTQVADVVEGRITFACGMTCGLIALTMLTTHRIPRWAGYALAALFALLAGAASPVAALVMWIVAAVAVLMRRPGVAATLLLPSAVPVVFISIVFGDGGQQPFSAADCLRSLAAFALVFATLPRRCTPIRIGAVIGAIVVAAAFVLPTPVGSNSDRLALLFALPVAASFIRWRTRFLTACALVAVLALQYPLNPTTITSTGKASGYSDYYRPLIAAIRSAGPLTGRVEVPEMAGHWDSVYLARGVPLARGWLRQTDIRLNDDVFYSKQPTPDSYRAFLTTNAVQYVAVPDAQLTVYGRSEYKLIEGGLPYLGSPIWRNAHWTLYRVQRTVDGVEIGGRLADPPAAVLGQSPAAIVLSAPADTVVPLRVRWYPWLGLESADKHACIAQNGLYVTLRSRTGGHYTLNSRFPEGTGHCPK